MSASSSSSMQSSILQSGKLRALAVPGKTRVAALPDVPTMAEAGYPEVEGITFNGIFAPKRVPTETVERLSAVIRAALAKQAAIDQLAALGSEARASTPEEFAGFLDRETMKWADVGEEGQHQAVRVNGRQHLRAGLNSATQDASRDDARFMALALALGRRGLGRTWPNPAVGAVIVRDDGAGPVDRRARLDATRRPPACRDRGAAPRRRGGARRDALRDARALLALRQIAALRRRHHRGRHRARRLGAGRSQSGGGGRRPLAHGGGRHRGRGRPRRRRSAARPCRPHPPRAGRPPARDAQARGLGRRQGRAGRPASGRDHRRAGARARPPDACDERRGR